MARRVSIGSSVQRKKFFRSRSLGYGQARTRTAPSGGSALPLKWLSADSQSSRLTRAGTESGDKSSRIAVLYRPPSHPVFHRVPLALAGHDLRFDAPLHPGGDLRSDFPVRGGMEMKNGDHSVKFFVYRRNPHSRSNGVVEGNLNQGDDDHD
jgi:hypothetical protein